MAKLILNGNRFGRVYVNEDSLTNIIIDGEPHKFKRDTSSDSIVLCHFEDDYDSSGKLIDAKGNIITRSGNVTGAIITDGTGLGFASRFGSKCAWWPDGIKTYLSTSYIPELNFLTGDFTIDFWVNHRTVSERQCFFTLGASDKSGLQIDTSGDTIRMWFIHPTRSRWLIGGDTYDNYGGSSISLPTNEWAHVAMVRNGNYVSLYINGRCGCRVNIGNTTLRDFSSSAKAGCQIGTWGYTKDSYPTVKTAIDEFRIVGKAVWTDEFTPPTEPYTK